MKIKYTITPFVMAVCLLCTTCTSPTEDAPRPLCGELEAFTMRLPGDTTCLTGIRHRLTGDTLVRPKHFISLTADAHIVKATLPNKRLWVYSDRGLPLLGKTFDSFVYVNFGEGNNPHGGHEARRFYVGTDYDRTYYYFPQRHLLLDVTGADLSGDSIIVTRPDGTVEHYGYDGGRGNREFRRASE